MKRGDEIFSKTRVAIILPSLLPLGGVEQIALTRATELCLNGYEVDIVLVNEANETSEFIPQGCRLFNLAKPRFKRSIKAISSYLKSEKPDVVHAAMWPLTSIVIIAKMLARSKCKIIVSDHNPLSIQYANRGILHDLFLRISIILTYPFADKRFTVSKGIAEDLNKLTWIPHRMFQVIYNTITLSSVSKDGQLEIEQAWDSFEGKRIITVGRLKAQKNHEMMLHAFKKVLEKQQAHLMILGTGELENEIKALIAKLGLKDQVIMPGHVSSPAGYYNSADLFVLSSDYEGFGNVIVEAMACGLPIVSTDCPSGPSEILEGGKYGLLVPVGDEDAMASAILEALQEKPDANALKTRAEKISGAESFDAYMKLLQQ